MFSFVCPFEVFLVFPLRLEGLDSGSDCASSLSLISFYFSCRMFVNGVADMHIY